MIDKGGLLTEQDLFIEVLDQNDNYPIFSRNQTTVYVDENSTRLSSSPIIRVSDSDSGPNARLNLTSQIFGFENVSKDEFLPMLKEPVTLSNQTCDGLEVTIFDEITATDNGENPLFSTSNIRLIVTDVNNHEPRIQLDRAALAVLERAQVDTKIASFIITDNDPCQPNNLVRLSIEKSENSHLFKVENNDLLVKSNQIGQGSDDLVETQIELTIRAIDRGIPPLSSTEKVFVTVKDSNDEPPTFVNFSVAETVNENVLLATEIGAFGQADIDRNSNLSQSITCQCWKLDKEVTPCLVIDLDRTTFPEISIVVQDEIDYEVFDTVSCVVTITDENGIQLQSVTEAFQLAVQNQNDFIPEFERMLYEFTLSESSPLGSFVGRVQAYDADGDLDPIFYFIEDSIFRIDENSGEIFIAELLDYESGF